MATDLGTTMNKIIGAILIVVGIYLLVRGHDISQSVNSQVKNLFTGSPTDNATYYYLGGAVCCAAGVVFALFLPSKNNPLGA
jgi:drug/metabolite transporter (DMT)-like permease